MFAFITGIDTGIGKTYVTGLLARACKVKGLPVITAKIAQTGCTGISEDIALHRRIMGEDLRDEDVRGETCPYVFEFPASPHLAAAEEGVRIDVEHIRTTLLGLGARYSPVIVEGVGGLCVPLTRTYTCADFLEEVEWPVYLVTSPRLGSINHTLLTCAQLAARNIPLRALLYTHAEEQTDVRIATDSCALFREMYTNVPVIEIPFFDPDAPPEDVVNALQGILP